MNKLFGFAKGLSGVTIGGSGGGKPVPLIIVTLIVLVMALVTAFDAMSAGPGGIDWSNKDAFICRTPGCGYVNTYTRKQLTKMVTSDTLGPMVVDCPQCKKHALTEARKCPKCLDSIFEL